MPDDSLRFLQLLQLTDSALPVGAAAHSFGLETLTVDETLTVEELERFLRDFLQETGAQESAFCRAAHQLASCPDEPVFISRWLELNARLSALKPARESRTASATLGRRFLQLLLGVEELPLLQWALTAAKQAHADIHACAAFGLAGGALGFEEDATVLAYLQQTVTTLVSACQRLLPLGQHQATRLLWNIKPMLQEAARQSREITCEDISCFTCLLEMGAMRHPTLATRLFIS